MDELTSLGVHQLSALVHKRDLSETEVLEAHLKRTAEVNPTLNAITDLQADRARERAIALDQKDHLWAYGAPITIKSSIAVKGFLHECGSPLRRGIRANHNASSVRSLISSRFNVIGTTNVPEFLMAYETDNAIYGRTESPIRLGYTPGGSSGGCAAAVAAGCAPASLGSDAGGSIRVPAHFCGVYGLKPTPGLISRVGHWPPAGGPSLTLAGVGPITKRARDLRYLLGRTIQGDHRDASANPLFNNSMNFENWLDWQYDDSLLRGFGIGWFDSAWDTPVTPKTRQAVKDAARALEDRGFRMKRIQLRGLERTPRVWHTLFRVCLRTLIEQSVPENYRLHPLAYDAMATEQETRATTQEDILNAWILQHQLQVAFLEQMKKHKCYFLLCPVAAIPAFRHGERSWSIEGHTVTYPEAFVYSQVFNVLGVPAAAAPVGKSRDGLPIGVQIVGRPYCDFGVAKVVESLAKGLGRH